jgi:hypothetical protein
VYDNPSLEQPAAGVSAPERRTRRRRRIRLGSWFAWLMVLVVLAALAAGIGLTALLLGERSFSGRIYPNISVRGLDLSGHSEASARRALERRYAVFLSRPVELTFGEQRWRPSAAELGLSIDIERALREAATIGRERDRLENARTVQAAWEQGIDLPLHLRVDQAAMQRYLLGVAAGVEAPPQDADLRRSG